MTAPCLIADELGDLRALIRTLRAREAVLRDRILSARPNAPLEGAGWVVTVRSATTRRFDPLTLPDAIREDPRYWKEKTTQTVLARSAVATDAGLELIERE